MTLLHQRLVPIGRWVGESRTLGGALCSESLIQHYASGQVFVVGEYLIAQFVDKLIKAEVHLSLHFVIEELFAENGESVVSRVVVEIQREENTLHHRRFFSA